MVKVLGQIIIRGAKIGYRGPFHLQLVKSHPSALVALDILASEIGPQPSYLFISSPLGLVPKSDGGWRRIYDLSFPKGKSVNNRIPT